MSDENKSGGDQANDEGGAKHPPEKVEGNKASGEQPTANQQGNPKTQARVITAHAVNPANETLTITVMDEPGAGGACHHYRVAGFTEVPPSTKAVEKSKEPAADVIFQNGPIPKAGVNGLTHEVLLAIVADRLRSFQAGEYACKENEMALIRVEEALTWLHKRTADRLSRQVEGSDKK